MLTLFETPETTLPIIFAALMGLSILIYVVLDGFDLGVGLLSPFASDTERDRMIASIGPFWDANETWLVLAIGLLLVAFPPAHGVVLSGLYLPVAIMLVGLILRGVAFEFRAKAPARFKPAWDRAFFAGSAATALSQGYMLGLYVLGLDTGLAATGFAVLTAIFLTTAYAFIGATWLVWKTEHQLQKQALVWARRGIWGVFGGIVAISAASPLASPRIFEKWFDWPTILLLSPMPLLSALVGFILMRNLARHTPGRRDWQPFALTVILFLLAFAGLAYSFYPYVVPSQMTIFEAAAAAESLSIILVGVVAVLPMIAGYTALSYIVFGGKARALSYD